MARPPRSVRDRLEATSGEERRRPRRLSTIAQTDGPDAATSEPPRNPSRSVNGTLRQQSPGRTSWYCRTRAPNGSPILTMHGSDPTIRKEPTVAPASPDGSRPSRRRARQDLSEAAAARPASSALDGLTFERRGRNRLRPARPERRRQVDHRQDPLHPLARRLRRRVRRGHRRREASGPRAPRDRLRRAEVGRPTRWTPASRTSCSPAACTACRANAAKRARGRAARPVRAPASRQAPGQDLLRRHGPQARRRDRPHAPPRGAVPRRADHRPRPRGPRRDVGRDRADDARRRA